MYGFPIIRREVSLFSSYGILRPLCYLLILITLWMFTLIFSYQGKTFLSANNKFLQTLLGLLLIISLLFFSSWKLIHFYILFELSLVPIFWIIINWGYQSERLRASLMLLFYTILASLPLLLLIVNINSELKVFSFIRLINLNGEKIMIIRTLSFLIAFLTKIPIFGVHLWLPKAHVEAPVIGSIILAAVLLKLGTFGVWLIIPVVFHYNGLTWLISLRRLGLLSRSLNCIRIPDLKRVIAYSRVSHIALILLSLRICNKLSWVGSFWIILSHSFTSSLIFLISNFLYNRRHRRRILLNKGLLSWSPQFTLIWFLLLAANMAAPPTINLFSELFLLIRIISFTKIFIILIILRLLTRSGYSLILFSHIIQGSSCKRQNSKNLELNEIVPMAPHLIWVYLGIRVVGIIL